MAQLESIPASRYKEASQKIRLWRERRRRRLIRSEHQVGLIPEEKGANGRKHQLSACVRAREFG